MVASSLIHSFPVINALLHASMLALASSAPPPPPYGAGACSNEVVAFSPCLPYISSPPNNISSSPSIQCCDVFSSAFETGDADCLCYLVRRPLLLGFPLNSTVLLSLSSLCPLRNAGSSVNGSLESICSGSTTLPPLLSTIGFNNSPPPLRSSLPESAKNSSKGGYPPDNSPTIPSSPPIPASSSAAGQINTFGGWFPLGMMIYLVSIFTYL
ncbi:hypothetical protein F0562_000344 [Nyssa sinensis]|uniref:Bifunctional inhibitor/plant lipid transfer protein/seed storage helical domain-containing protein n=1 Tax=Nyssa sinensis TaxID=561372 RepID=A0A5J5C3G8_9ASTE|nr:hypothetical protein F0562_000344 [Nyssa sinensis]